MRRSAGRITHVMQAIKVGDKIKVLTWILLGCSDFEFSIAGDTLFGCVRRGGLDRAWMEVVTNKLRGRECLCHKCRGYSVAAPDVGDARTAFEFGNDSLQCRKPLANEMVMIAGAEEPRDGTEQARRLVAPSDATTLLERWLHFLLVAGEGDHGVERTDHVDWTVIDSKHHR